MKSDTAAAPEIRFALLALLALALLTACASLRPRLTVVSPDIFPITTGDVSFGRPTLEDRPKALTVRLPTYNRGAVVLEASTVVATFTDSNGNAHPAPVRGKVDSMSYGEISLIVEAKELPRGLADLAITISGGAPVSLFIEIKQTKAEAARDRLKQGALRLVVFAAGFLLLLAWATSEGDCGPDCLQDGMTN